MPIPLYQDAVAGEMVFVIEDADIHFAFVENQEQVDKMLEVRESLPGIQYIIYDDPRGLQLRPAWPDQHRRAGGQRAPSGIVTTPACGESMVGQVGPQDVSVILYTSGTTGKAQGVCQTHASFIGSASGAAEVDKLGPSDSIISYLPPAWVGDHLFSLAQWLVAGYTINCPESASTISIDMREIGPTYYFAPPRVFEGMLTTISIRMEDAAPFKRRMYEKAMELARRVSSDILDGKAGGSLDRLKYKAGRPDDLRPAAQRHGTEPHPRGLHRGRGHWAGAVSLLPLHRHQPQTVLRPDRDLRLCFCSATARWI